MPNSCEPPKGFVCSCTESRRGIDDPLTVFVRIGSKVFVHVTDEAPEARAKRLSYARQHPILGQHRIKHTALRRTTKLR